jgi:hypothetical protein
MRDICSLISAVSCRNKFLGMNSKYFFMQISSKKKMLKLAFFVFHAINSNGATDITSMSRGASDENPGDGNRPQGVRQGNIGRRGQRAQQASVERVDETEVGAHCQSPSDANHSLKNNVSISEKFLLKLSARAYLCHLKGAAGFAEEPSGGHADQVGTEARPRLVVEIVKHVQGLFDRGRVLQAEADGARGDPGREQQGRGNCNSCSGTSIKKMFGIREFK